MDTYAVIGLGSIAKRHLSNLRELYPTANIVAVSASGRNKDLPESADALVTESELIHCDPVFVIVASPASYHLDISKRLIENGIAVLIEKPLADNAISCQKFNDVISGSNVHTAVGYCLRFLPSARVVKSFLDKGSIGSLYNVEANVGQFLPTWRPAISYKDSVSAQKELGGGALLELSHELDYLHWMLGDMEVVHSWLRITDELGLEVEEIVNLVLINEENVYVTVHLDFIQKSISRTCQFIGEHGKLVWDLIRNTVIFHDAKGSQVLFSEPEYDKNQMYMDMLRSFKNKSAESEAVLATVEEATKVMETIEDAKRMNKWRSGI